MIYILCDKTNRRRRSRINITIPEHIAVTTDTLGGLTAA
jgi:hypothetical protein